jgi:peptidoglycan/LPS O-acetylase OafA/YrhL
VSLWQRRRAAWESRLYNRRLPDGNGARELIDSITDGHCAPQQKVASAGRLRSLDGLRAVSIVLVLLAHLNGTRGFTAFDLGIGDHGHLGVVVFFVISGFLITRLLSSEKANNGRVSLKLFYGRRALRLSPACYAYLACLTVLWLMGSLELNGRALLQAATYTANFPHESAWVLGHLWSLSVEEQFYLLWPLAFVIVGPKKAIWIAAGTVLMGPVARSLAWLFLRGQGYHALFPLVADSLATGCLLALASDRLERQSWYLRLMRPAYSFGLAALVLLVNRYMHFLVVYVFGTSLINLAVAILIHRSIYHSHDWVGQFLNWTPIAFVGVLSYSLYLWQQPFLNTHSTDWISAFPQNVVLTIVAALVSYLLLEKPLLNLRGRMRARAGTQ